MKFQWRKLPKHWKYQLLKSYRLILDIPKQSNKVISNNFVSLLPKRDKSKLVISKGYAWDGSTVVMDTKACMRASCVHDSLYQLMREGKLDFKYRDYADRLYRDISIEDGMWRWHANLRYWGLKHFAGKYAKAKNS